MSRRRNAHLKGEESGWKNRLCLWPRILSKEFAQHEITRDVL